MKFKSGKLLAAAMAFVMMICLAACSSDTQEKYEQLKTDIIGMWCDVDGPEYVENGDNPYYKLYEFTSNGQIIYHTPMELGSVYTEDTYEIYDDYLTAGSGGTCRIEIENDVLTMITDNGSSQYRRMSMEEVCNFGAVFIDDDNYQKQQDYINSLTETAAEETEAAESESTGEEEAADSEQAEE